MYKKNDKGFTLIELLAVVIILIIVILIAITRVKKTIDKNADNALKANALSYFKTVQSALDINKTEGGNLKDGIFSVSELSENGVKVDGTKPDDGFIVSDNFNIVCACLSYGKYKVEKTGDEISETLRGSCDISSMDCDSYSSIRIFKYTGAEVTYIVPKSGLYKLEVWGAQGGNAKYNDALNVGGYGSYSSGYVKLNANDNLYINVGGKGNSVDYITSPSTITYDKSTGYNGGGYASYQIKNSSYGGGGGATSITFSSGLLKDFSSNLSKVLIVASGGGGASTHKNNPNYSGTGGSGGGFNGSNGIPNSTTCYNYGTGGTQSSVGTFIACSRDGRTNRGNTVPNAAAFGLGGNFSANGINYNYAGGGGGLYGGESGWHGPGGGGSGYIGNTSLYNKVMYCYNCSESSDTNTKTISTTCSNNNATSNCAKIGDGYAKITFIGSEDPNDSYDDDEK